MDHFLGTWLMVFFLSESYAQHSVTQPPSVTVSSGGNIRLTCTLGGGMTVSSNRVAFHQQKQNSIPRYILYYFSESNKGKGEGVPERFVGSGSNNIGYLDISGVQPEDEAIYYCSSWTGSQYT
ncbi:hypothetical protein GDO86_001906, partial [Hymenochirus boettgeri]